MRKWEIVATVRRTDFEAPRYTLSFEHLPVTIGASIDNDIVLDAPQVSSYHAHVTMTRGALRVHNRSRNGTFVGGDPVEQATIEDKDVVRIPPFELQFRLVTAGAEGGVTVTTELSDGAPPPTRQTLVPRARAETIEIINGPDEMRGKTYQLPRSGLRIGRSPTADLTIDSPTLSRLHADIRATDRDEWEAIDLQSANGTFVNGTRIEKVTLRPGDEIVLAGEVTLRFDCHDGTPAAASKLPVPEARQATGWEDAAPGGRPRGQKLDATSEPARSSQRATGPVARPPSDPSQPSADPLLTARRPLQIRTRRATWNKKVLIIELEGWLDGYNYTELGTAFDRIADNGERCVILDVTRLAYTDHTGLGVMMKAITAIERYGGAIRIVGAAQRLRDNISLARLDSFLKGKVLQDENDARREFEHFKG